MAKLGQNSTFQRLRNRYRLVVMNDDTYEEVVTFKLSRLSVYILMSSIFVLLVGLTTALIVFTPLKEYVPGYGKTSDRKQLIEMKVRVDSLEREVGYRDRYVTDLKKVLSGNVEMQKDTTALKIPKLEESND
jgi:hypothetical protein